MWLLFWFSEDSVDASWRCGCRAREGASVRIFCRPERDIDCFCSFRWDPAVFEEHGSGSHCSLDGRRRVGTTYFRLPLSRPSYFGRYTSLAGHCVRVLFDASVCMKRYDRCERLPAPLLLAGGLWDLEARRWLEGEILSTSCAATSDISFCLCVHVYLYAFGILYS